MRSEQCEAQILQEAGKSYMDELVLARQPPSFSRACTRVHVTSDKVAITLSLSLFIYIEQLLLRTHS